MTRVAQRRIVLRHGQSGPLTKHDVRKNYTYRGSKPLPAPAPQAVSVERYEQMQNEKEN